MPASVVTFQLERPCWKVKKSAKRNLHVAAIFTLHALACRKQSRGPFRCKGFIRGDRENGGCFLNQWMALDANELHPRAEGNQIGPGITERTTIQKNTLTTKKFFHETLIELSFDCKQRIDF